MNRGASTALATFSKSVRTWGEARSDIAGILLVGSWARGEAGPGSDVDLVILVEDPGALLADRSWLEHMGSVVSVQEEDWGKVQSLRVVHTSGLEVEYGLTSWSWLAEPLDEGTTSVLMAGAKVIFDRDGSLLPLLQAYLSAESGSIRTAAERLSAGGAGSAGAPTLGGGGSAADRFERWMVILGAGFSLVVTLGVWGSLAPAQPIWPLPAVYFVELLTLALVTCGLSLSTHRLAAPAAWLTTGAHWAFSFLARLSVGVLFAPVALVFGVAALAFSLRAKAGLFRGFALAVLAGLAQTGLILMMARLQVM